MSLTLSTANQDMPWPPRIFTAPRRSSDDWVLNSAPVPSVMEAVLSPWKVKRILQ